MKLADLAVDSLDRRLSGMGLVFQIGPFCIHLRSNLTDFAQLMHRLYGEYPLVDDEQFADIHLYLYRPRTIRRWWRPQVQLRVDFQTPFEPFPKDTALPFLEWGLNWSIATRAHQYLMIHAAVVEKYGKCIMMPALPGAGKSTLSAALASRGWRLLSDEFALIQPKTLAIDPLPKLIPLKNESIDIIRRFAPEAVIGPEFSKTRKGTVAHLRPPAASIIRAQEAGRGHWIVFAGFRSGAEPVLRPIAKERALLRLSSNSFNYELIGLRGFETAAGLIETCDCYLFEYGDLAQAIEQLEQLIGS